MMILWHCGIGLRDNLKTCFEWDLSQQTIANRAPASAKNGILWSKVCSASEVSEVFCSFLLYACTVSVGALQCGAMLSSM